MAGTLIIDQLKSASGVLATQNGLTGICKAWVNFNGTGTVSIRDSFNVSSITDNGTGDYTINFTTAMPNLNYAVDGSCGISSGFYGRSVTPITYSTSSIRVQTGYVTTVSTAEDQTYVNIAIFGA